MIVRAFKLESEGLRFVFVPKLKKLFSINPTNFNELPLAFNLDVDEFTESPNKKNSRACSVVLVLTGQCNLNCIYCYEVDNDSNRVSSLMTSKIGRAAVDHLVKMAIKSNIKVVRIVFFGGEPTLAFNLLKSLHSYFVAKCREAGLTPRSGISTNGTFSRSLGRWLIQSLDFINFSLDGPPCVQVFHRSKSSIRGLRNALDLYGEAPQKITFRATISSISVKILPEIVDWFESTFPYCRIHLEPLSPHNDLCRDLVPNPRTFFENFLRARQAHMDDKIRLKTSVSESKNNTKGFCGAVGENFVVGPDGTVVSCHRFALSNESCQTPFWYGHYSSKLKQFIFDQNRLNALASMDSNRIPTCFECFANSYCRGDCPAIKYVDLPSNFIFRLSSRCDEIRYFVGKILAQEYHRIRASDSNRG